MKLLTIIVLLGIPIISNAGLLCNKEKEQSYDNGYSDGKRAGHIIGYQEGYEAALEEHSDNYSSPSYNSVEVCGGGGTNVKGKHIPAGKTGCVRVYSDGRYEQY